MDNINMEELLERKYSVVIIENTSGKGYVAKIFALAGCTCFGLTPEEAMTGIEEAKRDWLRDAVNDGFGIPKPAPKDVSEEEFIREEELSDAMKDMVAYLHSQGITKIVPYHSEAADGIRVYLD